MKPLQFLSPVFIGLTLAAVPQAARSATILLGQEGTAVANCQGALPAFEGAIRKRPLSVQNEGNTTAFVTCSFPVTAPPSLARLWVNSINGAAVTVNCTAVSGWNGSSPIYSSKSVVAPATGGRVRVDWMPVDFGATTAFANNYISMSCSLPPGTGINDSYIVYAEEIGT